MWNSALNAAVWYSCDPDNSSNQRKTIFSSLKKMLGVRNITCGDLVPIETGLPDVKSLIVDRQVKFLVRLRAQHVDKYIAKKAIKQL